MKKTNFTFAYSDNNNGNNNASSSSSSASSSSSLMSSSLATSSMSSSSSSNGNIIAMTGIGNSLTSSSMIPPPPSSSSSSSSSSSTSSKKLKKPNILICGTPGTGKTTTSELVAMYLNDTLSSGFTHLNLSELVKERGLHDGYDAKYDSYLINDDKVCDELEEYMQKGGSILDTHSLIDYFPERWFHLVVVLTTDNTVLFDRLKQRKYSPTKIEENVQCEIMMVIAQEAKESYTDIPVQMLQSNTTEELESNVSRICQWAHAWIKNNN